MNRQSILNSIARELYGDKMILNIRPAHLGRNCKFSQLLNWAEYLNWNECYEALLEMKGYNQ